MAATKKKCSEESYSDNVIRCAHCDGLIVYDVDMDMLYCKRCEVYIEDVYPEHNGTEEIGKITDL